MSRLLIVLTLPPIVIEQYRSRLAGLFPALTIDVTDAPDGYARLIGLADMLLTFGQVMKNFKADFAGAANLKWIQALGTGLDGITDQATLKSHVVVTNVHGIHGE